MLYKKKQRNSPKDSKGVPSTKLLQALNKLLRNEGGSVSYVFITERFERKNFTNKLGEKDFFLEPIQIKSTVHSNISRESLFSNNLKRYGELKSAEELLDMFHSIKWDLGASYLVLD